MKWKALLFSLFLLPCMVLANQDQCFNKDWKTVEYDHSTRGKIVIYQTPSNYNITATNLACITAIQVLNRKKNLPNKMLIGIVSEDYRQAFFVQWSIEHNRFIIMETSIPPREYRSNGLFISYPEPLERIKEVMIVKKFPRREELPIHLQHKFKVNYVPTSIMQLKSLITDGEK